ncbi:unnamed protein product [Closterium sp. NIES-53]
MASKHLPSATLLLLLLSFLVLHTRADDKAAVDTIFKAAGAYTSGGSLPPVCERAGITCENERVVQIKFSQCADPPAPAMLDGTLHSALGSLGSLRALNFSCNSLRGTIPSTLTKLQHLTALDLSFNLLRTRVPRHLFRIPAVHTLRLRNAGLFGGLPVTKRKNFSCALRHVDLAHNRLWGSLPRSLARMRKRESLDVSFNRLSSTIPKSFSRIGSLQSLDLSFNRLSSTIPKFLSRITSLRSLDLSFNRFSGKLPAGLTAQRSMVSLRMAGNHFKGVIPARLSRMTQLKVMDLSRNQLRKRIPAAILKMQSLEDLLSGLLPTMLQNLGNLTHLNVAWNGLDGTVPTTLNNLPLRHLDLSHNGFNGMLGVTARDALYGQSNRFDGVVAAAFADGGRAPLKVVDPSYNLLTALNPFRNWNLTERIIISHNSIQQTVPSHFLVDDAVAHGTRAKHLDLSFNQIGGTLEPLSTLTALTSLDLTGNQLTGGVPTWVSKLTRLQRLHLKEPAGRGSARGAVRWELATARGRQQQQPLRILEGPKAVTLLLRATCMEQHLHDQITADLPSPNSLFCHPPVPPPPSSPISPPPPGALLDLTRCPAVLNLSNNALEGALPATMGTACQSTLTDLDLSRNKFTGDIPTPLTRIRFLHRLNLSRNAFSDTIPICFGARRALRDLDLSYNLLEGWIPRDLGTHLAFKSVALGGNQLSGQIHYLLKNFPVASFRPDNWQLCDPPLPACAPEVIMI